MNKLCKELLCSRISSSLYFQLCEVADYILFSEFPRSGTMPRTLQQLNKQRQTNFHILGVKNIIQITESTTKGFSQKQDRRYVNLTRTLQEYTTNSEFDCMHYKSVFMKQKINEEPQSKCEMCTLIQDLYLPPWFPLKGQL